MNKINTILSHLKPHFGSGQYQNIEDLFEESFRHSQSYRNVIKDLLDEDLIDTDGGFFKRQRRVISTNWNNLAEGINQVRNAPGHYIPIHAKITFKGIDYLKNFQTSDSKPLRILFLSANTEVSNRIRIDKEYKAITEELNKAIDTNQINLATRLAVDLNSLMNAIIEFNPNILHFSGHGSIDGIELEGENHPFFLKNDSLDKLIEILTSNLDCIVLNSCYSEGQALKLTQRIRTVIGMGDSIDDKAALLFSKGFYKGVAGNIGFSKSYELGKQMISTYDYDESEIPKLFLKDESNYS